MSLFSAKTGLSSILKAYSPMERDKTKQAIMNKVRFEMPQQKGLYEAVKGVNERNSYQLLNEFVNFVRETDLNDDEFVNVFRDARKLVNQLGPKFSNLVEALLALSWIKRGQDAIDIYTEFCIEIMVAHCKYIHYGIERLISLWIPADADVELWPKGTPVAAVQIEQQAIHKLLQRILNIIPMSFDVVLEIIEYKYPYYKKPPHVLAGYLHNVLLLLEYKPLFMEFGLQMVLQKVLILDVNAPRNEIEDAEEDAEAAEDDEMAEQEIFEMDDVDKPEIDAPETMQHPIAQTLDICLEKIYTFLETKNANKLNLSEEQKLQKNTEMVKFFKILLNAFDNVILPSHNTHHIQFVMFYFCSFKHSLAEYFLNSLWQKVQNPNVSAVIRQAAVGYMASFLARAKHLSISVLKDYLKLLCNWAHQYIQRCDQYRQNGSLKANLVFYSICQAIFYVIAFRSRDLTINKKSLLFLQSLQLSALTNCNFNPLRVCLPAVATAFAGVTRAYQLAYCHAILERNARRKLATVYANDTATPEELLDVFFPFDPYLLKLSASRITPHYLQYQASEAEEQSSQHHASHVNVSPIKRRKRGDSEMLDDHDVDDFILLDKRQRMNEIARSQERDATFTYGLSPGFHI